MKRLFLMLIALIVVLSTTMAICDGALWVCPICGRENTENYCTNCGREKTMDGTWICVNCGRSGNTENFCPVCGKSRFFEQVTSHYSVNNVIKFGLYPQSGSNKEPIQWRILDINEEEALLISLYALDCVQFNRTRDSNIWASSYVREWLNGTFYQTAFSAREKQVIVKKTIRNTINPYYPDISAGPDTQDNVFLLSVDEALKYLPRPEDRLIPGTEYAYRRGGYRNIGNNNTWWWLRSPGKYTDHAARVRGDVAYNENETLPAGHIGTNYVDDTEDVVIPCIWIDLTKLNGISDNSSSSQPVPSYNDQTANLKMALATRSGPGTNYDEPGTFFYKNDQWKSTRVNILGKKYNGVWWVLVDFDYGSLGSVRAWTGLKRVDTNLDALPEMNPTGAGTVYPTRETRYGPGTKYMKAPEIHETKKVTVFERENGYVEVEYYDPFTDMYYRCWVPDRFLN